MLLFDYHSLKKVQKEEQKRVDNLSGVKATTLGMTKYVHFDVMDGVFVPSISFGMPVIEKLRGCTDAVFDVHMMVEEPGRYIADVKKAGADIITVHYEACEDLEETLKLIKSKDKFFCENICTFLHSYYF